jgi:hypothetical protein
MERQPIYIVYQKHGLKAHLSLDTKGRTAICGHKIKQIKTVERFQPGIFGFALLFMTDIYCQKWVKNA